MRNHEPDERRTHTRSAVPASAPGMIRVLVVDDHPAVRAGLVAVLRSEPGLVPVGAAADQDGALGEARRRRPDVALVDYHLRDVDYHLRDGDGLLLCRDLKSLPAPPRVLIYSAFADGGLGLPATIAGADGLVDKGTPTEELFERVRTVARGQTALQVTPQAMSAGAARLETRDLPILGMLLERTPPAEIAKVLRLDERELDSRVEAMLTRLRIRTDHDPQRA
jgi:DNA-binding NarL/FixJ family response regulator